ncbi:TetR/AcrR family transcriptional regulator [Actinocatenispora rupis]|uniref:TetR family transcriptional regulator n=1 Tax=Actinocatenispora rupis TaxID=519421 RepID=A0A8J3JH14_9ACTN|nr:TetR/AcrR family transcriptional regulator [Actinocatenispora rupis]GID16242.1 TetR family transcriptional regulator [Actinocatenispora rupis]
MPDPLTASGLRADARRNRDQLLDAARALFSDRGPDVPMEEIARRAGVGVGTLYRRFSDRDTLIRAVALDTWTRLLADARTAEAEEPDAWHALRRILQLTVHLRVVVRMSMFSPRASAVLRDSPEAYEIRSALLGRLERLVDAAQADGALRPDVGAGDLTAVVGMIIHELPDLPDDLGAQVSARCIGLVLDGLAAPARSPLPGTPVRIGELLPWASARPGE